MRIALIMTGGGGGGLQQSVVPYATALTRSGHEVLAIILQSSPFVETLRNLGVKVVTTRWPRRPMPFAMMQARTIRREVHGFNADLAIGFASKGLRSALLALQGDIPVLTRCGSTNRKTVSNLLHADGMIVTSDEMRTLVLDMGMPAARTYLFPNFLTGAVRQRQPAHRPVPTIGSLGRMVRRKGFDSLVEACGLLRRQGLEFRLIIGGSGGERSSLGRRARALGVAAEFPGWIPNDRKDRFFDEVDVFVCPSRDEPFGFIYLEAMQAAVPVVTTDTVGARFIFTPGTDARVVAQGDVEAMATAIKDVLENPQMRSRLAEEAGRTFMSRFELESATETLDAILGDALKIGLRQ